MGEHQSRHQFWAAHLHRCREQGLTMKAYAEREGLTLSVLYGWSKRLKREAAAGASFSRVRVLPAAPAHYRLHMPNGLVLEWSGEADAEGLSRLVKSLR